MTDIFKKIQSFFDKGSLTVVGSGLSCAEGLSSMYKLSERLIDEVPGKLQQDELSNWKDVEGLLKDGVDLESALQQISVSEKVEKAIIEVTFELISYEDRCVFIDILENDRTLKFADYLSCFSTNLYNLVVITTNYDLLIEYACEFSGLAYSDTYLGKIVSNYSPNDSESEMIEGITNGKLPKNKYKNYIKLLKPHGSINWKLINGELLKINNINFGEPCIITPGSNKYQRGYEEPFDYHIGNMGQEIDNSKKVIFLGYGFNDNHLETHLNKPNNINKPKLIVTKRLSESAKKAIEKYPDVIAIEEYDPIEGGTKIYCGKNIFELKNKNLWDLSNLIEEIF